MAANFLTQWDQIRTIMDGYKARIERLETEKKPIEDQAELLMRKVFAIEQEQKSIELQMKAEAARISKSFTAEEATAVPTVLAAAPAVQAESVSPAMPITPATPAVKAAAANIATAETTEQKQHEPEPEVEAETEMGTEPEPDPEQDATDAAFESISKRASGSSVNHKRERSPSMFGDGELDSTTAIHVAGRPLTKKARSGKADKVDYKACIHPDYPTIVPSADGEGWVELRCKECGANYSRQKHQFIRGAQGMMSHYMLGHKSILTPDEKFTIKDIVAKATHHLLTEEEVSGILAGDPAAYVVEAHDGSSKRAKK